ncbi:hypothetical protein GCM10027088_26270 [Nocardia goodfellowii]
MVVSRMTGAPIGPSTVYFAFVRARTARSNGVIVRMNQDPGLVAANRFAARERTFVREPHCRSGNSSTMGATISAWAGYPIR